MSLGGIKTLAWSLVLLVQVRKVRGQTTSRILGWNKLEHGQGLHYHELPQAPCASVAGSCSKCCKPQRSKAAYSEDDNVNSVAPETSSEVKGPEADVGGTKADQEELQCHHAENHWKSWKSMPCPVRGRFCSRCKLCSNWGILSSTCSSMSLSKLLSWSCWLNEVC